MLRAVAFDMDGLMFNTEDLYVEVGGELLRRRGRQFTQALLDRMMGRPSGVALQEMIDMHGLDDSVDDLRRETDEIFPEILEAKLAPLPGLTALLAMLEAQGVPKAVTTSSRRSFVDQVLGKFELGPRFDFVLSSEDVRRGKPHPEIYQLAASRFQIATSALLVLEDSAAGCAAGVAAGAFTIAVPSRYSRQHDFSGAEHVADSLQDRRIYESLGLNPPGEPHSD